jgi:hypothetical protein
LWLIMKLIGASMLAYPIGLGIIMYTTHLPYPFLLAITCSITVLYAGLVWLYASSSGTFRPELKTSFLWVCINMVMLAITAVASTAFCAFPALGTIPALSYGGFIAYSGFLSFATGYISMRRLALATQLKTWLASWPRILVASAVLCLLALVIPHTVINNIGMFRVGVINWTFSAILAYATAALAFLISRQLTARYRRALTLHATAYLQAAILSTAVVVVIILGGPLYAGIKMTTIYVIFGTCGVPLIMSGYMFNRSVGKS